MLLSKFLDLEVYYKYPSFTREKHFLQRITEIRKEIELLRGFHFTVNMNTTEILFMEAPKYNTDRKE